MNIPDNLPEGVVVIDMSSPDCFEQLDAVLNPKPVDMRARMKAEVPGMISRLEKKIETYQKAVGLLKKLEYTVDCEGMEAKFKALTIMAELDKLIS